MASGYAPVEADDVLFDAERSGQDTLQFKTFDTNGGAGTGYTNNGPAMNRGYSLDQPQTRGGFWSLDYYQQYFDVDTNTVLKRCYTTLIPTTSNYVSTHLTPQPDLYGPFWTLTTLIFCLFVFSSLASSIVSYFSTSDPDTPETLVYNVGLLSIAVSLVYAYGIGVPVLVWGALRWLGEQEWSLVEALAVWGYGQFVWIPVSALCVIPVPIVRWVLVGIACGLSGFFLFTNIYPVLSSTDSKVPRLMVIILAILHLALALVFKVLFFSYYVVHEIGTKDPLGENPPPITEVPADGGNSTTTAAAMAMMKMFRW